MALSIGARLGPYEILGALGAGGMGEVYRARDPKLGRDVALKILPEAFASDPERIARFRREAQVLASLNHPSIAAIHGLDDAGRQMFLVLELAEGEDLARRIARGPLSVDEAVAIATQIADALEAAHEHGIVHRDLKPANIKVTDGGRVKVLDFGLAKAMDADGSRLREQDPSPHLANSPTMTTPAMTAMGMILGTAAYMSPEQAKGRPVDKRADIWSFGVVVFEMLTGRRLFHAETVSEVLAAVLRQDIDWTLLPPATPASLRQTLGRCLERDPKKRLRDIGDARLVADETDDQAARRVTRSAPRWNTFLPWLAGALGMLAVWLAARPAPDPPALTVRSMIELPDNLRLPTRDRAVALSPEGTQLALVLWDLKTSKLQLYLRALDKLELRPLGGTEGATYPFWSPDGGALGFFAANQLRRIDLPDGPVRTVCAATAGRGASWGADDQIVFSATESSSMEGARLFQVSASGSEAPKTIGPALAAGQSYRVPQFLPNHAGVLYERRDDSGAHEGVYVLAPGQTEPGKILDVASEAQYAPPGWLGFVRDGLVMVQPFDLKTLALSGKAEVVAERVHWDRPRATGHVAFSNVFGAAFVYERDPPEPLRQLEWLDREGRRVETVGEPAQFSEVSSSPDGTRALVVIEQQLWLLDLASGVRSPFHSGPGQRGDTAIWSPDGRRVAFREANGGRLAIRAAEGTPESQVLIGQIGESWGPSGWSPDGSSVVTSVYRGLKGNDLAVVAADGKGEPKMLLDAPASEDQGTISPDGKWLAFISDESGQTQLYVTAYPALGRKWPVTKSGAVTGAWTTPNELRYVDPTDVEYAVPFRLTANGPQLGARQPLLGGRPRPGPGGYARTLNRFLVATPVEARETIGSLVLVTNWQAAIKK